MVFKIVRTICSVILNYDAIKGTIKTEDPDMNGSTIPDCLDDFRSGSLSCSHNPYQVALFRNTVLKICFPIRCGILNYAAPQLKLPRPSGIAKHYIYAGFFVNCEVYPLKNVNFMLGKKIAFD